MKNLSGMKTIDELIRENKDFFEDAEPSKGHMERFTAKLELRFQKQAPKRSIVPYLLRAAVVTLLVTLSSLWTWDHFIRPSSSRMTLGQVSPQYKEVENYYIHQVNMMEGEIVNIDLQNNPEQKKELMQEMKSMDSVYVSLQKELKANPNDERIINAMIEHYQTKLEIMNYIVSQLQTIKNENQNRTEDEKIKL
jgi:cytochrome c-type biogenesis protein CcmH/NrfG